MAQSAAAYVAITAQAHKGDDAAFRSVVDRYLHQLTPVHARLLLDFLVDHLIDWLESGAHDSVEMRMPVWMPAFGAQCIQHFALVVERLRLDQEGWDFVGVALFAAFLRHHHISDARAAGHDTHAFTYTFARAVSDFILPPLLLVATPAALRLDWKRLHELAEAWVLHPQQQQQPAIGGYRGVYRPPMVLTPDSLAVWMADLGAAAPNVHRHWNASIRAVEVRLRREAAAAQTELCKSLPADLAGAIAHFLAPATTTQADLQRQRQRHAAAISALRTPTAKQSSPT